MTHLDDDDDDDGGKREIFIEIYFKQHCHTPSFSPSLCSFESSNISVINEVALYNFSNHIVN